MMTPYSLRSCCIAAACFLTAAGLSLYASPLPKSQVPSDAKWVIHLDIDRFAASQTCKLLAEGKNGKKSFQAMLDRYRTLLGVDPLKDLTGLTLYGSEITGDKGTALISGSLNHQAVSKRLSVYPQYTTRTYGKLRLQTWTDKATGRALWACFYTTRLLILASDEGSVLNAAATLDGSKSSLTTGKTISLPVQSIREGCFFTAASKGYAGSNADPIKAMILKSTESATMQLSETGGMVDGNILLKAISPDSALQIHQVLNGLMVSATLADSASPIAKLAGMSEVSRNDKTVVMKLHCPATDAVDLLGAAMPAP